MLQYILRRILWMIPTMFGITLLLMLVIQLAPGDPAAIATAGSLDSAMGASGDTDTQNAYEKFRERYRLDDPFHVQYGHWVANVAQLDFGNEFHRADSGSPRNRSTGKQCCKDFAPGHVSPCSGPDC